VVSFFEENDEANVNVYGEGIENVVFLGIGKETERREVAFVPQEANQVEAREAKLVFQALEE